MRLSQAHYTKAGGWPPDWPGRDATADLVLVFGHQELMGAGAIRLAGDMPEGGCAAS